MYTMTSVQGSNFSEEQRYTILQPQFELNPAHPLIKKLANIKTADPHLAVALTEQLFANAMVSAGTFSCTLFHKKKTESCLITFLNWLYLW